MSKRGKFDFSEFKHFAKKMENLSKKASEEFVKDCNKELAARLLALVIPRTPVGEKPDGLDKKKIARYKRSVKKDGKIIHKKGDVKLTKTGEVMQCYTKKAKRMREIWKGYIGGTLRRGWLAKKEEDAEAGKGSQISAQQQQHFVQTLPILKSGNVFTVTIENPVHYASYVEFGHTQTPGKYIPAIGKKLKKAYVPGKFMLTRSEQILQFYIKKNKIIEKKQEVLLKEWLDDK